MGALASLNPINWFKSSDPAPAPLASEITLDPSTGLYINRRTGQFSTDPGGANVVTSPSLQAQAARSVAVANALQQRYAQLSGRFDTAVGAQQGAAAGLQGVINGTTPSVAQGQLAQGQGQIAQRQEAEASGTTGVNAALARMAAAQNIAQGQAQQNQQAAVLRAQEVAGARQQQAGILGDVTSALGQQAGVAQQGQVANAGVAGTARGAHESGQRQEAGDALDFYSNAAKATGSALAVSDERAKHGIKAASPELVKEFGNKLTAIGYKYDDPEEHGEGEHVGVKAQDLLKSRLGKKMVVKGTPMRLDPSNVIGGTLAVLKSVMARMDKLERA